MEVLDPAARSEEVLRRRNVPRVGRDPSELKLDAVLEPAGVGVGELAPRAQREDEGRPADEVVTIDVVLELLGGEDDEEVLQVVEMH
jgi:hypothetical protein